MDKRAGRRLEDLARQRWRAYARTNWKILVRAALVVAGWAVLGVIPALIVYGPFGRGVAVGSLGTVVIGFFVWIVAEESGAIRAQHGATGEQNTAEALTRLRRLGWQVRHDLHFDRYNVDHVLVGPHGIFAVETKTTSGDWDFNTTPVDPFAHDALRQTRAGARKIRLLLSSLGSIPVQPMLICWGPGVVDLPDGHRIIDGVTVVIGRQAREALPLALAGGQPLTEAQTAQALEHIDDFIARRDRHESQTARRVA